MKTKAELETLRARVNPHFLFNAHNSIASLIKTDPDKAEQMIRKLSDLFRYNLDSGLKDKMKLKDEIDIIRKYLEIEKVRLGDRLRYDIVLDEKLNDFLIPGLLIQPLVENSVKHGIAPKQEGGESKIDVKKNNGTCNIKISDTGKGFDTANVKEGFGLGGVNERLSLYYGKEFELSVNSDKGVTINLTLPLNYKS